MRTSSVGKGREAEELAAVFLEGLGWEILGMRVRTQAGEIDILARDGDDLVAVEVKARSGRARGTGLEAVGRAKVRRIMGAVAVWCSQHEAKSTSIRLDVVSVDLVHGEPVGIRIDRDVLGG